MRLEEWQKYLEARFLDDSPPESKAEKEEPLAQITEAVVETPLSFREPSAAPLGETTNHHVVASTVDMVPQEENPEPQAQQADIASITTPAPPTQVEPGQAERNRKQSLSLFPVISEQSSGVQALQSSLRRSQVNPSKTLEVDIPDFAHFLPPNHPGARSPEPSSPSRESLSVAALHLQLLNRVQALFATTEEAKDVPIQQGLHRRSAPETYGHWIEKLLNPELTLEEVARLLHVPSSIAKKYVHNRWLRSYHKGYFSHSNTKKTTRDAAELRFRLSDVLAFAETYFEQIAADRSTHRADAP